MDPVTDYTYLLKRNFITLMNMNYELARTVPSAMHRANEYARLLLRLPCHPILSEHDLKHAIIDTPSDIIEQIHMMLETNDDLYEVACYIRGSNS